MCATAAPLANVIAVAFSFSTIWDGVNRLPASLLLCLHTLPQLPRHNGLVLAGMDLTAMRDLSEINAAVQNLI
jgi:hypothetical protein